MPLAFFRMELDLAKKSCKDLFIHFSTSKSPLYVGIEEYKVATKLVSKISIGFYLILWKKSQSSFEFVVVAFQVEKMPGCLFFFRIATITKTETKSDF